MNRSSDGVALVLVLMVTAVLAITVLAKSLGAQSRVRQSAELLDRTEAMLNAHSHETAVAFSLLTEPWTVSQSQELLVRADGPYGARWNFRAVPFEVGNAVIRMQDESGLLAIPRPGQPVDELSGLMSLLGFSESARRTMLSQLARQDPGDGVADRNIVPLQDISELFVDSPLERRPIDRFGDVTTLAPVDSFNPATAPREVLIVKFGETIGGQLYDLASRAELDTSNLQKVVGVPPDENTMLYPGPVFRVWVGVRGKSSIAGREMVWLLRPYDNEPFREWSSRRLGTSNSEDFN